MYGIWYLFLVPIEQIDTSYLFNSSSICRLYNAPSRRMAVVLSLIGKVFVCDILNQIQKYLDRIRHAVNMTTGSVLHFDTVIFSVYLMSSWSSRGVNQVKFEFSVTIVLNLGHNVLIDGKGNNVLIDIFA